ncbi:hypothetical protein C0J52_13966 [Blattella germanica]|nr:hypothetical protein C0J52_13966 [Blattella germanica]
MILPSCLVHCYRYRRESWSTVRLGRVIKPVICMEFSIQFKSYGTSTSRLCLLFYKLPGSTVKMARASMSSCFLGVLLISVLAFAYPIDGVVEVDEEDTQLVESTIREVRALPPPSFDLQAAGTDDHYGSHSGGGGHGDVGYLKTKNSKGDQGYQKFDSYHKKDGDSYGYETHSAFGKAKGGETGGKHHHSSSYSDGHSGGGSYQGAHSGGSDDGGSYQGAHSGGSDDGGHAVEYEGAGTEQDEHFADEHEGAGTEGEGHYSAALTDGEHHYSGHEGGRGSGSQHSAHYSSGDHGHHGGGEHHSSHYASGGDGYHGDYHH